MYHLPGKTLLPWQQKCLELWFKNGSRGIVNVVTGAGKTLLALGAAHNIREKLTVKIVVPKVFLASQWIRSITEELHVPRESIGIYTGSFKNNAKKEYMVYVVNSARYSISRHILADMRDGYSVLLICDECHHYGSEENAKIFDFLPFIGQYETQYKTHYYSLGLSATPRSPKYKEILVPALGKEIFRLNFKDAVSANVISKYSIFNIGLDFTEDEAEEYQSISEELTKSLILLKKKYPMLASLQGSEFFSMLQSLCVGPHSALAKAALFSMYERKRIVYSARNRIDCACSLVKELPQRDKIIIFGEQIQMVEALYKRLNAYCPNQVCRYHSKMSTAAKVAALDRYCNSQARILICCRALDEGLNVPETDAGIILSSTGSVRQRVQRIGRILRRCGSDGVKNVYYLHINNSVEEDGLIAEDIYADMPVCDVFYNCKAGDFYCPGYDPIITGTIDWFRAKGAPPVLLGEIESNLKKVLLRGDIRLSEEQCAANIAASGDASEKNYWIAVLTAIKLFELS